MAASIEGLLCAKPINGAIRRRIYDIAGEWIMRYFFAPSLSSDLRIFLYGLRFRRHVIHPYRMAEIPAE